MDGPHTRALADALNDALTGKPVDQILVPSHRWQANMLLLNCVGQVIQRVRSHGKWIFFDFSHGITWLSQLVTRSKWTILTPDQAAKHAAPKSTAKRPREPLISLHLRNSAGRGETLVATLTGNPIFYILPSEKVRTHPEVLALGPDPLSTITFYDDFPYRLRQHPNRTVAAALLEQETVAGIGNALKCEILYAMRFAPSLRVGSLLASQVDHLAGTIVGLAATATTFATKNEPFPYRVFDRSGLPCGVCNADIRADRSAHDGHLTWYCPACQPLGTEPTLFT